MPLPRLCCFALLLVAVALSRPLPLLCMNTTTTKPECPKNVERAICNALLRFPLEQLVVHQGAYCKDAGLPTNADCPCAELANWTTAANESAAFAAGLLPDTVFTWVHYAVAAMEVQYKFCHKTVPPKAACPDDADGVVAVVKTGVEEWKPRLAEHTCRCRDNRYHLRRWIRVDGFWEYHYVCHLPFCPVGMGCARQHFRVPIAAEKNQLKNGTSLTTGVEFDCHCGVGSGSGAGAEGVSSLPYPVCEVDIFVTHPLNESTLSRSLSSDAMLRTGDGGPHARWAATRFFGRYCRSYWVPHASSSTAHYNVGAGAGGASASAQHQQPLSASIASSASSASRVAHQQAYPAV